MYPLGRQRGTDDVRGIEDGRIHIGRWTDDMEDTANRGTLLVDIDLVCLKCCFILLSLMNSSLVRYTSLVKLYTFLVGRGFGFGLAKYKSTAF